MSKKLRKSGRKGSIRTLFGHKKHRKQVNVQRCVEVWTQDIEKKHLCPKDSEEL